MTDEKLKEILDEHYKIYAVPDFIKNDPIQIPHSFNRKEDIEISGFLVSIIAWGQRVSIIKNGYHFMSLMDNSPYNFVMNFEESDLKNFDKAIHRTFNGEDLRFFVRSLRNIYDKHNGLENIFSQSSDVSENLAYARKVIFEIPSSEKNGRHISDVGKGSAAKRLNMFLRWMVRPNTEGVDFGIWKTLSPANLMIPLDVHCGRIARELGLLSRTQNDWKSVVELTMKLRSFCPEDPIKYDYALFGTGVNRNSEE